MSSPGHQKTILILFFGVKGKDIFEILKLSNIVQHMPARMVLAYLLLAPEMMAVPAVLSTPTLQLRKDCLHITSTKHRQTLNLNDMFGHSSSAFLPVCQTESSTALPSCGAVSTTQRSNASACHREDEIDAWLICQFQ